MMPKSGKPLHHHQFSLQHKTQFQRPPLASTHVVDEISSEAIVLKSLKHNGIFIFKQLKSVVT